MVRLSRFIIGNDKQYTTKKRCKIQHTDGCTIYGGKMPQSNRKQINGLKVRQWLNEWNDVLWDQKQRRREPEHEFYLFTMSAVELKALSGVNKRSLDDGVDRSGIQRRLDQNRTDEINLFVKYGYPWS